MSLTTIQGVLRQQSFMAKALLASPACSSIISLIPTSAKTFGTTCTKCSVWEPSRKGDYEDRAGGEATLVNKLKEGAQRFPKEVSLWKDEMVESFQVDARFFHFHKDFMKVWNFGKKDVIDGWTVTTDKDMNEGLSEAEFVMSERNHGLFRGVLKTEVPKDGAVTRSGYCSMRGPRNTISFGRYISYDWSAFTHLIVRCKGDGRPYQVHVAMNRFFDINWNDAYHFPLYTRGGPYWQVAKIPFSKFYRTSKGRIQDRQGNMDRTCIASLAITLADQAPGRFELEVDFIGLVRDETHTDMHFYEMYKVDV